MTTDRIIAALELARDAVVRAPPHARSRVFADSLAASVGAGHLLVGDRLPVFKYVQQLLGQGSASYQVMAEAHRRGILWKHRSGPRAEWGTYIAGEGSARAADPVVQRWGIAIMATTRSKETELARVIAAEVRQGILEVGYRIPTTTHLAPDLGLAHATVRLALKEALRRGVLMHQGQDRSCTTVDRVNLNNLVVAGAGSAEEVAPPHPALARWRAEFSPASRSIKFHIAALVRSDVQFGRLEVGEKLPYVREVADALGIDRETAMLGYQIAKRAGLVEMRKSSGTFVTESARSLMPTSEEAEAVRARTLDPVQRIVSAGETQHPQLKCATSVFDLGEMPIALQSRGSAADLPAMRHVVARDGGVTRVTAVREQDTPEWAAKEQARRARQKPPRPPRQKFRTKNSRVWAAALDEAIAALPAPSAPQPSS